MAFMAKFCHIPCALRGRVVAQNSSKPQGLGRGSIVMYSDRVIWSLWQRLLVLALPALGIVSCDLLPSDGPNANYVLAGAIEKKKADPAAAVQFALVAI